MELIKNYPWAKELKAPEESFKKWRAKAEGKSFACWSLTNRLISPKLYFDWAVEHYQIPFLEDIFFEQHLILPKQWEKIKSFSVWTKELLPVTIWEGAVFIGCVEPPADRGKTFPFKHRFVLASSSALQTVWKFTQELSRSIQKGTQTSLKAVTDKEPLAKPILQTNSKIKAESPVPKTEETRAAETDNQGFSERSPAGEDNNLIVADFKQKAFTKKSPAKKEITRSLDQENGMDITVSRVDVSQLTNFAQDRSYDLLWKQTQAIFCSSMILKVKKGKVFLSICQGQFKAKRKDEELLDLKEISIFTVVQRGWPYHGFVVDNPANKKFFSKIGWDSYPNHVTAIPVQNPPGESLRQIFMGLSTNPLSRNKIKEIEKTVSDFFQSQSDKMAA